MWAKLKAANPRKDKKELKDAHKILNVNEEYLSALRTKSYAEFLAKAHPLVINQTILSSPSYNSSEKFSKILLEPDQETIPSILESAILSKVPELKGLMLNYFDISAEASSICAQILNDITHIQYEYKFIQQTLDTIDDDDQSVDEKVNLMISMLNSPVSDPNKIDFKPIQEKYSSVLHHLKSKRKKVARKMRMIKYVNKATGICLTAACSLITVTAVVLAAHTLTAILMGPMIFSFPTKCFKKKLFNFNFSFSFLRSSFLGKVREQLDAAAKGTYILNRDFDTMGRLVARLHDEVEHNKAMIRFCLDRREDNNRFSLHVMKELKRNNVGFQKQVEELEEHVYLCLVSINRARVLVTKEMMTTSCVEELR